MDVSSLSNAGLVNLAQAMTGARAQLQVQVAMVKLANDQIQQDGAAALQLIEATPLGSQGLHIDLMV